VTLGVALCAFTANAEAKNRITAIKTIFFIF
jgi:hypothetical protein